MENVLTAAVAAGAPAGKPRRITFSVSTDASELARDAAYQQRVPVVALVETAIGCYADELERETGEPIPRRPAPRRRRRV